MSTGQMIDTGDGAPWLLDAGAPSLDFAYTADWGVGLTRWDLLRSTADLGHWLAERYPGADPRAVHEGELRDARALRDAISRLAIARVDGAFPAPDDIDTLNLYAAAPDVPPVLAGGRRQAGASRIRTGQALSSIARDAVAILQNDASERLRRCAADDCRMIYRDESRTGTRRWCSMQRCGNRAKVRAHRARRAALTSA
ncbi:ABATE domain-containing protein [Salinibacterium sp. ZJ70]|uniref:CGNR zinc finger domain-containing protein n=1 Tax=Salinibacterium sp. ZJ70 TaxID=2708084 RepID=UPI001CD6795E|nr:ABATE domain-containing protein [Salinibacterium sp. ZJ70]